MAQVLCPVLIGRSEERVQLEAALADARSGSGQLILVVGEAGIGKSRLLHETATTARDLGMQVLAGRAVPGGARIPFRPLIEAVQSWTRVHGVPDDPALRPYRSALGWLIPEWKARRGAAVSPVLMLEAAARLLSALAGRDGLLISLDDLHWADADTLSVLEYLADNMGSGSVLCLGALRTDEESAAAHLAERLTARRAASRIPLRRLSDREVDEMIATALPGAHEVRKLEAVRARAEGVPFLVEEMLSAYVASGTPALPASYRELLRARTAGLDPGAIAVIGAAAAIGRDFDWRLVAAITGMDEASVLAALRAAIAAQMIGASGGADGARFSFRHALIREAILEDLLPPERIELFLRAADALESTFPGLPGELCQIVADLRERAGDRTDASRLLLEIARRAVAIQALGTAEGALRRAAELAEDDRWRTMGVRRLLVEVLAHSGKTEGLREIGEAVLEFYADKPFMGSPRQFAEFHTQIARGLATAGDRDLVDRHLVRARDAAEEGEHQDQMARIDAFAAHVLLDRGEVAEADRLAAGAGRIARERGLDDVMCEALRAEARIALVRGDADGAVQALERARLLADRADLGHERPRVHLELARIDRSTTAEVANALKARELSERVGAVAVGAEVDLELARLHIERFELAAAEDAAERSVSVSRRYGLALLPWGLVAEAQVLALRMDRENLERKLGEVAAISPEAGRVALGEARAVFHLLRDERAPALAALEAAAARSAGLEVPWPFLGLDHLLKVLGGAAALPAPAPAMLAHAASRGSILAAHAIALGRLGDPDRATQRVADARKVLAPFPWRRSLVLRVVAEAAVLDRWGDPAAWAGEALGFFEPAGYERVAAACRGLLRRAGVRVSRRGRGDSKVPGPLAELGITSREMDVLRLVGEGLSNAEIAERLFVSVRTVETHASSLLRKSGVDSRSQLVAFASRVGEPADVP